MPFPYRSQPTGPEKHDSTIGYGITPPAIHSLQFTNRSATGGIRVAPKSETNLTTMGARTLWTSQEQDPSHVNPFSKQTRAYGMDFDGETQHELPEADKGASFIMDGMG